MSSVINFNEHVNFVRKALEAEEKNQPPKETQEAADPAPGPAAAD